MDRIIAAMLLLLVSYGALAQTTGYRVLNPSSFSPGTANGPGAAGAAAAAVAPYCAGLYHVAPNATVSGSSVQLASMCRAALAGVELSYFHTGSGQTRWLRNVSGTDTNVSLECYVGSAGSPNCGGSTSYAFSVNYVYLACTDPQLPSSTTTCADPPSDPCEETLGDVQRMGGVGDSVPPGMCIAGCAYRNFGVGIAFPSSDAFGGRYSGSYKGEGRSCDVPEPDDDYGDVEQANDANCITSAKGRVCLSKMAKNCGTVNGETVCLDSVPSGSCTLLSGGGVVCDSDHPGLVDENGDPVPLDSDWRLTEDEEGGSSTSYSYYSQTTVNNSGAVVEGSSSGGSGDSGFPEAPGAAGEGGEGSAGWGDCESPAACAVDSFLDTIAEIASESSLLGVFAGSAAAIGGSASCPSVTFTVPFMNDAEFDILGPVCDFMEPHYGLFTLMMQIAWSLLALRVFWVGSRS